jgi:uncharacterized protein YlxW (UPF0749 family)
MEIDINYIKNKLQPFIQQLQMFKKTFNSSKINPRANVIVAKYLFTLESILSQLQVELQDIIAKKHKQNLKRNKKRGRKKTGEKTKKKTRKKKLFARLEELKRRRGDLRNKIDRLNSQQMCIKVLINSCYGLRK